MRRSKFVKQQEFNASMRRKRAKADAKRYAKELGISYLTLKAYCNSPEGQVAIAAAPVSEFRKGLPRPKITFRKEQK